MTGDPSALWGSIGAAVGATITLLVAFGIDLTPEQTEALLGFVATVGPLVTALLIRRKAWKPSSVRELVELAVARGEVPMATPGAPPLEHLSDPNSHHHASDDEL